MPPKTTLHTTTYDDMCDSFPSGVRGWLAGTWDSDNFSGDLDSSLCLTDSRGGVFNENQPLAMHIFDRSMPVGLPRPLLVVSLSVLREHIRAGSPVTTHPSIYSKPGGISVSTGVVYQTCLAGGFPGWGLAAVHPNELHLGHIAPQGVPSASWGPISSPLVSVQRR